MNRDAMDYLTSEELVDIGADVADLLDDTQITVAITYRDFQSRVFTPGAGTAVATYTDTTTRAVRSKINAQEVQASQGLYQSTDVVFLLAQSDVPVTPHREDRLVIGSTTYEVLVWQGDALGATWRLVARQVSSS